MISHRNRVQMTVSGTPGTGTITVNAASSGYQAFAAGDNAKTFDCLFVDGTAWEVARGCTYTHSGTTISRGTLEASSTGSAISLTSAAIVAVVPTAALATSMESAIQSVTPGGRLTLESGVPISTSDQTAKTMMYYTPYVHNIVNLWDGSEWTPVEFSETSLALGTLTSGKPYDVFGYLSGGALTLESLVWTSDTARATAVTLQDGRYCKSGDKTRLLLGTFYTQSTTTTEDSEEYRLVSNVYNRVPRRLFKDATASSSHTYTVNTPRQYNNGTGDLSVKFVASVLSTVQVSAASTQNGASSGDAGRLSAAYDSTSTQTDAYTSCDVAGTYTNPWRIGGAPLVRSDTGRHTVYAIETVPAGTVTFNAGRLVGWVMS